MTNNRAGSVGVRRLEELVNERDRAILRSIQEHRYLTTRQIFQLHFWSHQSDVSGIRACTRVLTRLSGHRLLYRLSRSRGGSGGGSSSYVWGLDVAGDRLLRAAMLEPTARLRPAEPTPPFLTHTLAVADVRVRAEQLAQRGELELLEIVTEPATWRTFTTGTGKQILKPDLYLMTARGDWEFARWIEVDLGTESLPVLIRKCLIYEAYRATGLEEATGSLFPAVLWLMHTQTRAQRLRSAIVTDKRLRPEMFTVTTIAALEKELATDEAATD